MLHAEQCVQCNCRLVFGSYSPVLNCHVAPCGMLQAEVSYDYFRDAFIVAAGRPYREGQQVFVSYGRQSNDSLMQFYGFAEQDNPDDVYVMTNMLKWLEQLQRAPQAQLDVLNHAGLLTSLQEVVITREGFAAETLQALRYLLAAGMQQPDSSGSQDNGTGSGNSAEAANTTVSTAAASQGPADYATAPDPALEARLALVLVHACDQELAALGSSLQEDKQLLRQCKKDASSRECLAIAFRIEKKEVLLSCVSKLRGQPPAMNDAQSEGKREPAGMAH